MQGGKGEPCISWQSIRVMQAQGRLCPLVELLPSNRVAAELSIAAIRVGGEHPLWGRIFDLHTEGMEAADRIALLYRVMYAVGTESVAARVKRLREVKS